MGISKRKRMAVLDELPPAAPHHAVMKMRQRALVVARNSEKGLWSRYAVGRKETLITYAGRLRKHEEWQQYGALEVAYRPMASGTRYALWVKFKSPQSERFTQHLAAVRADLGAQAWDHGDPDDPGPERGDLPAE